MFNLKNLIHQAESLQIVVTAIEKIQFLFLKTLKKRFFMEIHSCVDHQDNINGKRGISVNIFIVLF